MRYKVTFVIPVFNRLDYTKECLQDLDKQKETRFFKSNDIDFIVVDDGSTDGTGEWLKENYPDIYVPRGDGNLWYSKATNIGMKHAFDETGSDFVMVWENDTFPVEGYFDHLQEIVENWDGNTLICSKLYYRHQPDRIFGMGGTFNRKTGQKTLIGRTELDGPEYQSDREVDWFLGIGFMVHKTIVEKVGYLDEKNFPHYHADIDYSLRAQDLGCKNIVFHELGLLNDTETTGINHKKDKSFKDFFMSLTSIKSNRNIKRNIRFYRRHTTSILAYFSLAKVYMIYTASFIKWKVLGWFGIRKDASQLN